MSVASGVSPATARSLSSAINTTWIQRSPFRARGGGRYLRRIVAVPDPNLGFCRATCVSAGLMVFPAGSAFGPRKQTGYEVILLHQGQLVIEIDGALAGLPDGPGPACVRLRPGQVTLLVPGPHCTFRFSSEEETHVSYAVTYDPALSLPLLELLDAPPVVLPASNAMARLLDTLFALPDQVDPDDQTAAAPAWLSAASIALFADGARAAGLLHGRPAVREHPAIAAARNIVRQRLAEHIGLKEMAGAAHVAPEHLVRLFRLRLGTTPVRYLWAARVRLGVHLLENTDLPVAEIARRAGCKSPKHFTRLVRAALGVPPREVRKRTLSDVAQEIA